MRKYIILIQITFVFSSSIFAKNYTEKEFIEEVSKEVKKRVEVIKNKSVADLTKELIDKEEKIALREIELQKKEDALKASEAEITKKYAEFNENKKQFIGCVDQNEQDSKNRVGQLVEMISNMKPQKAAEILSVQEEEVAVKIIQMLDPKKASKIFNFMDKDISAKLQKQFLLMQK